MKKLRLTLLVACLLPTFAEAVDTLYPTQILASNGRIVTPSAKYQLIMQADGNLVMYRADGTVRYSMAKNGAYAMMQQDGNFVEYSSNGTPLFSTGTWSAVPVENILRIQEDGNLVVYGPGWKPLWNIGVDQDSSDPTNIGDVVGRDLAFTGAGFLGHLGIFDGSQIVQVGPPVSGNNAVHYESLQQFKNTLTTTGSIAQYWGTAHTPIADGSIFACWQTTCIGTTKAETTTARVAVAKRARQIYLIGADYTSTAYTVWAAPGGGSVPPRRGSYRCDTFVSSALYPSGNYGTNTTVYTQQQRTWADRAYDLMTGATTPSYIFNKIKDYK